MQSPPKLPTRILRWFCPDDLLESVEGDLLEAFERDLKKHGDRRANWLFFYNVLRFFRIEIISRNKVNHLMINRGLLLSHVKVTLRNFQKQLGYSFINLTGLALGIAVCMVIYGYTNHQLQYDDFHPDIEQLYRINQTNIWDPEGGMMGSTPPPLAQQLIENIPQVESVLQINTPGDYEVRYQNQNQGLLVYRENSVLAADSNFFEFFAIPLIHGDQKTALTAKNMVVITKEIASKYFGDENPVGKTILMNQVPVQITAVTQPLPHNMHFKFDFLISIPTNPNVQQFDWSWIWTQMVTYVKLKINSNPASVAEQVTTILNPQVRSCIDRLGMDYEEFIQDKGAWQFAFQPVRDIHLHSLEQGNRLGEIEDIKTVRVLQILALLILIIAIINFVNLSTARANLRTKEIGVKRSLGAVRSSLRTQFYLEAVVMTFVAAVLSIPFFFILISLLKGQANVDIYYQNLMTGGNLLKLLVALITIGLIAGIYPAIYLTSFKPINVLGGLAREDRSPIKLRYILVAIQFAISLTLLSGSFLVAKQLRYLSQKDLGFDRENILIINHASVLQDQIKSFRDEVRGLPEVLNASISMDMPGRGSWEDIFMREGSDIKLAISQLKIDPYFFPVMNLKTIAGRPFKEDRAVDVNHVIINETTAKLWGWTPSEALGKQIIYFELEPKPRIIGIVDDFHFQSLHQDIRPLIFFHIDSPIWGDQRVIAIKYRQDEADQILSTIKSIWNKFADDIPLDYSILDEELHQLYRSDMQLGQLIKFLTYLSIFIALLGLIGLVAYTTEQRKREIGIRKVLGASIASVFLLINKQYLYLLTIGLIISIPSTWYVTEKWLQDFAYHISVTWHVFGLSAGVMLLLAICSAGYLVLKAARANPIEAIRE